MPPQPHNIEDNPHPNALMHLCDVQEWTPAEFQVFLSLAKDIEEDPAKYQHVLRGRQVATLFFEPSTRTVTSFQLAARALGASVTTINMSTSSTTKGESYLDTLLTFQALGIDMFVIRSSQSGASDFAAQQLTSAQVVNAGDGLHAHPTQALLDLYTLYKHCDGKFEGKKLVIVGDIFHSRVARSNLLSLTAMGVEVMLCGPPTLLPKDFASIYAMQPIPGSSAERIVRITASLDEALCSADAVMALRLQKERQTGGGVPSAREYRMQWGLTSERMQHVDPPHQLLVMHPGPMNEGIEIDPEVAHGPQSVIEEQVSNGVIARKAVLVMLQKNWEQNHTSKPA